MVGSSSPFPHAIPLFVAANLSFIYNQSVPCSIKRGTKYNSLYILLNLHAMTAAIDACKNLIDTTLPAEFPTSSPNIEVKSNPQRIIQNFYVALYGQSNAGNKIVNMRSPTLQRELKNLATRGPGETIVVGGVRYRFHMRIVLRSPCKKAVPNTSQKRRLGRLIPAQAYRKGMMNR